MKKYVHITVKMLHQEWGLGALSGAIGALSGAGCTKTGAIKSMFTQKAPVWEQKWAPQVYVPNVKFYTCFQLQSSFSSQIMNVTS